MSIEKNNISYICPTKMLAKIVPALRVVGREKKTSYICPTKMFAEVGPALREKGKKNRAHCKKKKTEKGGRGGRGRGKRESKMAKREMKWGKITDGEG